MELLIILEESLQGAFGRTRSGWDYDNSVWNGTDEGGRHVKRAEGLWPKIWTRSRMSRRAYIAGVTVAVALTLGATALFVVPAQDSPTPVDAARSNIGAAQGGEDPTDETSDSEGTGQAGGGASDSTAKNSKPAASFGELDFDETRTSPDLVRAAVCDLSGRLLDSQSPDYKDSGEFRDLIVITEEKLANYRLVEEIDPRIKSALNLADRVVKNWNLALYSYEAGDESAAKKYMARAEVLTEKVHKAGTGDLCPTS